MSFTVIDNVTNKHKKICDAGFTYNFDREYNETTTYWYCEQKKSYNCGGRVTVVFDGNDLKVTKRREHSHSPDVMRKDVLQFIDSINTRALGGNERPREVIRGVKRGIEDDVLLELPKNQALSKRVKRLRADTSGVQNTQGPDLVIPEISKKFNGESFLLGDNENGEERVIVFGSLIGLKLLYESKIVSADGTFKSSPHGFSQVYTIHATVEVNGRYHSLPVIWCILQKKTATTYEIMWQIIKDAVAAHLQKSLLIRRLLTDFEKAIGKAALKIFPECIISFCHFHLCQTIYR